MRTLTALSAGAGSLALSFVISVLLTPALRRWARQRDFVDRPSAGLHKSHREPIPFGGGIAITVAILVPIAFVLIAAAILVRIDPAHLSGVTRLLPNLPYWAGGVVEKTPQALAIIAGALVMHLVGIIDDHRPLSAMTKLVFQVAVALMITAGFGIRAMAGLGPVPSILLTTLWIVGITNAFNFLDNMDGLSGGVAFLTAVILAMAAFTAGQLFVPCALMLLAGAVLGFLIYNFPPATIFMGDAGSLVVGFLLAVFTVLTTYYAPELNRQPFGVLVPLIVFAVPIYDIASVMFHRYRIGQSVFQADRRHFSHRLVNLGMSRKVAVLTIYLATAATALPAIVLPLLDWFGALLIFGQCVCVVTMIAILESREDRT